MTPTRSRKQARAARPRARRAPAAPQRTPGAPGADETGARERILGAALQVFAERGFDGARTREVSSAPGAPGVRRGAAGARGARGRTAPARFRLRVGFTASLLTRPD